MFQKKDIVAQGYLLGWKIVRKLPESWAKALFNYGADYASQRGKAMPQLRKNLMRVVGKENVTRQLVQESMRSYARYWREAFVLPSLVGNEQLIQDIEAHAQGTQFLRSSVSQGKGVILVLPHSGNWDMAGLYLVSQYGQFTTVAERLEPTEVYEAFVDFRQSLGFKVLPHQSTPGPYGALKETLLSGGIVCLLGERDLKRSGVEVEFFGEKTRMPAGAVRLAQETGAALHVVHSWFIEDNQWGTSVSAPVEVMDLKTTMQTIATLMEENIRQHPKDWHMLQPLWLSDLDARRYQQGLDKEQ
ncbi:phosphatidylinositol mannoside acyltransferase [Corynebacterium sp. sy017]|uniref:phosphatidylinositol mannoside acyltransferase n=1 Tax=unclassified Corynebacterium TaxID=2624378 RepID=UPI0011855E38|nr:MULTISPECIES: phosphatidylinositol mannoside acyltransferase [unclassified Corynebacterium]MBP3087729.1 phosphatidylinositol mannoside acyltransferase [Corynebacterium sp. sy017]QDZ42705.1 phosphatidylinositol mannoside acyltransferase [Corynebacterium sp. sy039]TSD92281.1 phosphatidylinositol mannoside acyltransferase [Corynebacterium sp. SY003]